MVLLNEIQLKQFEQHLINEECAASTIEKYMRDIRAFLSSAAYGTELSKETILEYKKTWRKNTNQPAPTVCWLP